MMKLDGKGEMGMDWEYDDSRVYESYSNCSCTEFTFNVCHWFDNDKLMSIDSHKHIPPTSILAFRQWNKE